jgi:hypothetical protein
MKPVRLRDFLEADGMFFSVVGYRNEGRVKAFLRYIRDSNGDRLKDGVRYRKLSHQEAIDFAKQNKIEYYSHELGIFLIPHEKIDRVYKPEEGVRDADGYVRKVVSFFDGIPLDKMGVTGSRLIGLVGDESDVDFVMYGDWWFRGREKIKRGIQRGEIQEPDSNMWEFIYKKRKVTLPFHVFLTHERRKYHRAVIDNIYFDLLFVRDYSQLQRDIPEEKGVKTGKGKIVAELVDDSLVFDYPAFYPIKHREITAILCFTHTFVGQAQEGEVIEARGDIETINGKKYLIVGTKREVEDEYIISRTYLEKRRLYDEFKLWEKSLHPVQTV